MYSISVVIPTAHHDTLLDTCLAALIAQDLDPTLFEIVIVDLGNSPKTRSVVARWQEATAAYRIVPAQNGARPWSGGLDTALITQVMASTELAYHPLIRYIPVTDPLRGQAHARNLGWRAAQGEFIAFTNDDCIPRSDWLRRGLHALLQGYDGVTGQVEMLLSDNPTDYEINASRMMSSEFVTANCFYRKHVLETAGGFDECYQTTWWEDTDLFFTLLQQSARLTYEPNAVVLHPIENAPWGVSLAQQRRNYLNAILYRKHPGLFREKVGNGMPAWYWAAVVLTVFFLAGLIFQQSWIAAFGGTGWLILTLWFAGDRLNNTSRQPGHILEIAVTSALIPLLACYWRLRGSLAYRVWFS